MMGELLGMHCRSCGSGNVELIMDLGDQPHCNRLVAPDEPEPPHYPLRLGFCHDCTLVQIDHTIPKDRMFLDYPYVSGTTATLREHFNYTANRLTRTYRLKPGALIVDIGANDGTFLEQWPSDFIRIGVDPALNMPAPPLVPIYQEFFDKEFGQFLADTSGHADIITAAGVFFHLEDLHSVCEGVKALLAADGVLVVQCIYLGGMVENTAFDQIYHEHLCYYTLRSLFQLCRMHGLGVFHVEQHPIHGGTLEAHIGHYGARPLDPTVTRLLKLEEAKNLGEFWTYQRFAEDVQTLKYRLLETLHQYRDAGKSVWAYGAPAKGATLLNTFQIDKSLVQKAVEKNPLKVGKVIPGCRIPIVAESDERPDAYLMLAWNFLPEFITKEAAYIEAGGQFIVPIPHCHIVQKVRA